jgi:hypothetical protein
MGESFFVFLFEFEPLPLPLLPFIVIKRIIMSIEYNNCNEFLKKVKDNYEEKAPFLYTFNPT